MEEEIRKIVRSILKEYYWDEEGWGRDLPGPDPFSPGALGNEVGGEMIPEGGYWKNGGDEPLYPEPFSNASLGLEFMPENESESNSKWPTSVEYPSFGLTAVRETEGADVWKFLSPDYKFIATYRVNPSNLSVNLKKAAEKAFNKWMDIN